jgi:hypothetical protein
MVIRVLTISILSFALTGCIERNHCATATKSKGAYEFAQEVVSSQLRSPSTAQFPDISDPKVFVYQENFVLDASQCSFVINAFVDAQNGFGAMVRSRFEIIADYNHSTKTWLPTSIIID